MADLRSELLAVRAEHGSLTPATVLHAATAANHPLHDRFEWDDKVAGHKYRLGQASQLIRVVKESYVDASGNPESMRFFHAVPGPQGMAYEPVTEVIENEVTSKILLASMEREWRQLKRRYERFAEFSALILGDLAPEKAA